jgi:hypothetical protein
MRAVQSIIALLLITSSTAALIGCPSVLVYPSGPTVPENLLRIELRFSSPLRPPLTLDQVKLLNPNGAEIKDAFLDLPLAGANEKSVTLLLHPGRVKSGVGANLVLGRALRSGMTVTLMFNHPALAKPVRKNWQVTAYDAESPQPAHWTIVRPRSGSRSPLVLHLDNPISSASEYLIAIRNSDGSRLAGNVHLEEGETVWRFVPAQPWRTGNYAVVTHPDLEDCAGNRPCAPFEAIDASQIRDEAETALPFELTE